MSDDDEDVWCEAPIFGLSLIDSEEKLVFMKSMDEVSTALVTAALPPRAYLGAAVSAFCASFSVPFAETCARSGFQSRTRRRSPIR